MLTTERLTLRPFTTGDAEDFLGLAGHWDVARMTSDIPHPLSRDDAQKWLQPAPDEARFALVENGSLVGGAGYFLQAPGAVELGFWLGRAYWGRGLATEAVKAVVSYGLLHDKTAAFTSSHFTDNPASGRTRPTSAATSTRWASSRRGRPVFTVLPVASMSLRSAIGWRPRWHRPASASGWRHLLRRRRRHRHGRGVWHLQYLLPARGGLRRCSAS